MTFAPAPTTSVNVKQSQEQEQSIHVSGGHHTAPVECAPPVAECHPAPAPVECHVPAAPVECAPPVVECHPAPAPVECHVPAAPVECAPPVVDCHPAPAPVECHVPAAPVECAPPAPVVDCHPVPPPVVECHPAPAPIECHPVPAPIECHPIVQAECHSSAVNDGTWIANHQVCFDDGLWFGGAMNFHGVVPAQDVSCSIQSIGASFHDQTADLFAQINCHPIAFTGPDCVTDVLAQHALQGQTQVQSIDLSGSGCHNVDLSAIQVQTQSQHIDVNSAVCVHPVTFC